MTDRIQREQQFPVAPAELWERLTDPAWLALWLADEAALELVVGGEAEFVCDGEPRSGWVEEVSPPDGDRSGRLAFWWQADDEPASRVELEISEHGGGTRLRVTETRPLELLDLVGIPLRGSGSLGAPFHGPALVAA